ncbi:quinone-dependent dihydroorotate dehydrogenase [Sphingomonas aracearum]|uniref:Dihydroorotate dehydrogenase (quinone) n=1 Tax=Sphingomonas aracearum TaxID=2283317 RepID=A0A369W0X3_9SPHN|nr:quinone-dependent dihydroorotate dehydrogenase [Sphingomonas aracearum]RDE05731.1 quinone-dependent dihydroorotate dehydrogenase [Sphingomonas aracearum]
MVYPLLRRALFSLEAEQAHDLTIDALAAWGAAGSPMSANRPDSVLETQVAGVRFPNPIGLAAGLDKNARAIRGLSALGFGSVEVGTLTPRPQPGNPRPRLFRLEEDGAIINRMGFNNGGLDAALARLKRGTGVLGINVGANKEATDRVADYVHGVTRAAALADYVTINISSPNTPGLRDLQHGAALRELLAACTQARGRTPLFLKVAPDLHAHEIDDIARAAIEARVDALIVSNTTVSRPSLASRHAGETGGLSGVPLAPLARARLADFRAATGGSLPLVSVGGIDSGAEAYARIRAGASLVQVYSALIYEGPGLPSRMARELAALLRRDGFARVGDAVGVS